MLAGARIASLTAGSGLADQAKSWISTNSNQLISGQQVASWLGSDKLKQLAQATGLNPSDVADHLAKQLPAVIDKLTPHGSVPDQAGLESVAGQVGGQ